MNTVADINICFQNCIVGLSAIIYSRLSKPHSIDYIFTDLKKAYYELNVRPIFTYEDIYEALLLLYSLGKIELDKNGEVIKV